MKPNNNSNARGQQDSQQNNQADASMHGPEAAAKRDVEEAEKKAKSAKDRAEEIHAELRAELEAVQEELAEVRELASWNAYSMKSFATNASNFEKDDVEIPEGLKDEEFETQLQDEE